MCGGDFVCLVMVFMGGDRMGEFVTNNFFNL